jgi:hypothetical protein
MRNEIKKNGRWPIKRNTPDWLYVRAVMTFFARLRVDAFMWCDQNMLSTYRSGHILFFFLLYTTDSFLSLDSIRGGSLIRIFK